MKVGDLVRRSQNYFGTPAPVRKARIGIVTRDLKCARYEVLFFDTNSLYNMDKRLLEVISESR